MITGIIIGVSVFALFLVACKYAAKISEKCFDDEHDNSIS